MSAQVARFAKCATSVMRKARVEHLDSFDVATAAKNTVLRDGKLTSTAVRKSHLSARITPSVHTG